MFNEPIQELQDAVDNGDISHDGDPVLRWAVGNAICVSDRQDRMMYDKATSVDKIDPVVALTMAFRMAILEKPYTSQGFIG